MSTAHVTESAGASTDGPVPVLVLGGAENTLSLVRGFGARGIPVHVVGSATSSVLRSRYCAGRYPAPDGRAVEEHFADLLLETRRPVVPGAVLFACSDPALSFMAEHSEELGRRYRLSSGDPEMHRVLLDKQRTLGLAQSVGIPIPEYREVVSARDADELEKTVRLPVLLKPRHTWELVRLSNQKLIQANSLEELRAACRLLLDGGIPFMATEFIPGPDSLLSSYYTFVDPAGDSLFRFTKRVIRRSPPNFGGGCYHVTDRLPETEEVGRRFFDAIGLRGFGNVEFKRDPRDGALKLIEVNARFTAAQELVRRAGIDMPWLVYRSILGDRLPEASDFRTGLYYWYPLADVDALRDLRRTGELRTRDWFRSVRGTPKVFPWFRADDPVPAAAELLRHVRSRIAGRVRRLRGRTGNGDG